ncbi:MAG: type II toxin-antitoxin system RelE/ParE family toxin [Xanthomonadales bacterium]|nr:type II toxin-antitoxin system RelE/ParE family toxin [Xanthomonadales bacterium]
MQTVVELPHFIRLARSLLSETEISRLINYLATQPEAGDLIEGTGGIRKLRWAREGRGKSGGTRVIYFFHNERMPLYLLTIFGKNEQSDLSMSERNELRRLTERLVAASR